MKNYILNPDFDELILPTFHLKGVGDWIAKQWWCGPGAGGVCDVSFPIQSMANLTTWGFRRNPRHMAELNWSVAPISGDDDSAHGMPRPNGGWTFLEHAMFGGRTLMGKGLAYYFRAACFPDKPNCTIVPLFEINYHNSDYMLFPQKPIHFSAAGWGYGQGVFQMPKFKASDVVDDSFYVGFHLDFDGLVAPHIALTDFSVFAWE